MFYRASSSSSQSELELPKPLLSIPIVTSSLLGVSFGPTAAPLCGAGVISSSKSTKTTLVVGFIYFFCIINSAFIYYLITFLPFTI